jgi:GTP-binding protein
MPNRLAMHYLCTCIMLEIKSAKYIISSPEVKMCPKLTVPEVAFIGRSNVGKSSIINMLSNRTDLAKISRSPGKTQMINHFEINKAEIYWVDLPGYGFAKVSQTRRHTWTKMIWDYLEQRENLATIFVLIDSRHAPQNIDIDFINKLGEKQIPFTLLFTKADKSSQVEVQKNVKLFMQKLATFWDEMPQYFVTSAVKTHGRKEVLTYMGQVADLKKEMTTALEEARRDN